MKDLKQLEKDVVNETKLLEGKAFELFVKDYIKQDLEQIEKANDKLNKLKQKKDAKDLDYYKREFNTIDTRRSSCVTYKEIYLEKIK